MRSPIFGKGGDPKKKLISFRFFEFINKMVKAEADDKDTTESILIERKIMESYLNEDERIARIISENINKENGIVKSADLILEIFKNNPSLGNDSLLEFLEYIEELVQINEVRLKITDEGVKELARYASEYERFIRETTEKNPGYNFYDTEGKESDYVDTFSLNCLKDMKAANEDQYLLDNLNLPYICLTMVLKFWNFGGYEDSPTLKHWAVTYGLLQSAIRVCYIPDYGPYIYRYSQTVKKIDMHRKGPGAFNSAIKLSKQIFLKMKAFDTTKDAVVIKTNDSMPDDYFTNALRIIHGPGKPITRKPYIVLTNGEEEQELYKILAEKLEAYPDEFPDTEDAYAVQFLFNGAYYDKRVRWRTI